jgi:hypothetical protein
MISDASRLATGSNRALRWSDTLLFEIMTNPRVSLLAIQVSDTFPGIVIVRVVPSRDLDDTAIMNIPATPRRKSHNDYTKRIALVQDL